MANAKLRILYPDGLDSSSAKIENMQLADRIFTRQSFPNGLVLEYEQYADHIDVRCNHKVVQLPDGSLKIL